ncbi:hypothetical protein [Cytobacillus sp. NCCP-133]|uniref:hypothetical protein n=1 Tax=Cytobacillus sp. NCCP-133 TaxID=766848 RepID=UPI00222FC270|nr:hypothetical protein [Cytobacillus sp. NCCP-133]GLB61619.1 hypothetical protein NCCP133_37480 [Cytobacillus sp. NCCP-133]
MMDELLNVLEERKDEMIAIRSYLHQNPELSFKNQPEALQFHPAFPPLNLITDYPDYVDPRN